MLEVRVWNSPSLYIFYFSGGRILTAARFRREPTPEFAHAGESSLGLALMTDAFGEGPGPLARDIHKF
jgi:hypothetical protein